MDHISQDISEELTALLVYMESYSLTGAPPVPSMVHFDWIES